jgi:hypothetical protein
MRGTVREHYPAFERFVMGRYAQVVRAAPKNSLTPDFIPLPDGSNELILLAKCEYEICKTLTALNKGDKLPIQWTMEVEGEGEELWFGLSLLDMYLKSGIYDSSIPEFLNELRNAKQATLIVLHSSTLEVLFATNLIRLTSEVQRQFEPMYARFGV